jgi:hypothetical protein
MTDRNDFEIRRRDFVRGALGSGGRSMSRRAASRADR